MHVVVIVVVVVVVVGNCCWLGSTDVTTRDSVAPKHQRRGLPAIDVTAFALALVPALVLALVPDDAPPQSFASKRFLRLPPPQLLLLN